MPLTSTAKLLLVALICWTHLPTYAQEVYFTNGYKVAELSSREAIVWTRLCGQAQPNPIVHQRKPRVFRHPLNFNEGMPVSEMDGAVRGAAGYVRAIITSEEHAKTTEWHPATSEQDFTVRLPLSTLRADTEYTLRLEGKATLSTTTFASVEGTFRTPPEDTVVVPVSFTTSTCQYFWSYDDSVAGFRTYRSMATLGPDFFVQTGDYVYYDKPGPVAKTPEKARHKWHAMNGWPSLVDFFRQTPTYLIKDDHDLLSDDAHSETADYGRLSYAEGLAIWRENVPVATHPYRTFRWGKDLQLWLLEGREYRSANALPDSPTKTILGRAQKAWLINTLSASDATFKIVISATPVVGPDRENKADNHANAAFQTEGEWLRRILASVDDTYVINGDRHWQYVSQDSATALLEFGSGPVSNAHVQGWNEGPQPEHQYLKLIGGFLGVSVDRPSGRPTITFTHYNVHSEAQHTTQFTAD